MKKLTSIIYSIIFVLAISNISCQNMTNTTIAFEKEVQKDSVFFLTHAPFNDIWFDRTVLWNALIANKISFSMYQAGGKKIFFIKEFQKDSIKRFFYETTDMDMFRLINYDSLDYDKEILQEISSNSYYKKINSVSKSMYNIHKIRQSSIKYIDFFKKKDDEIKELEKIVNEIDLFQNFSIDNKLQVEVLKELIFSLRIIPIDINESNTYVFNRRLFEFNLINQINTRQDFKIFENKLSTVPLDGFFPKLFATWNNNNCLFLRKNIDKIEAAYKKHNVFVFYRTIPTIKVFIYEINIENEKIKISENYINKNFYWEDPYFYFKNEKKKM